MQISRRDNLDRFYLFKAFGYGIFFHYIHDSEVRGIFHNHPWDGFSIIFGSYTEEYRDKPRRRRWLFNFICATRHHRVEIDRPVGTLFFHGPRYNRWEVVDSDGKIIAKEPWRGVGGPTSYSGDMGSRNQENPDRGIDASPVTTQQETRQGAKEDQETPN